MLALHSITLCSFANHIFVSSGWLLDLKTERSSRSPPLLLITPGSCNYDIIYYCNTVFFLACGCVAQKKKNCHYHFDVSEKFKMQSNWVKCCRQFATVQ